MSGRKKISTTGILVGAAIGAVIAAAVAGIVLVILLSDRTGRGPNKLPPEFRYDISQLRRTDPALVLYEQAGRIETGFDSARCVAVGPDDRIYVGGDRSVSVFDPGGARLSILPMDDSPRSLAIAADGTIYVGMADHVRVYSPGGERVAAWPSPGDNAALTSIAVSGADVFVADAGNSVVLRYDVAGRLLGRIGRADEARGIPGLILPSLHLDVAVGAAGILWVSNPGLRRLEAYTFDGALRSWWGQASSAIEGFCGCCNPTDFAIIPGGGFATSEKGLPRVKVYDDRGGFVGVVAGTEAFEAGVVGLDLAVDSAGRIMVLDPATKAVRIFVRKEATPDQ